MNTFAVALFVVSAVVLVVAVVVWIEEYKHSEFIKEDKSVMNDFYTLGNGVRDEDSW